MRSDNITINTGVGTLKELIVNLIEKGTISSDDIQNGQEAIDEIDHIVQGTNPPEEKKNLILTAWSKLAQTAVAITANPAFVAAFSQWLQYHHIPWL